VEQPQPSLRQSLRAARSNRPFIFSLLMFLMTWVAVDIVQASLLFFVKHVAQREPQSDLIMATIFVTAIFAVPVWLWASGHWGKRGAFIGGIAFWAVVQIVLITVTPATALAPILVLCVLAGVGVSAAHLVPWSIIPDSVEWDEWKTGERHEGMFYSLTSLAQKVASSIAVPLVLLLLEFTGYAPNAAQQPASAVLGIRIAMGPVPAVLLCVGIAIAFFYPLGRDQHRQIVRELEKRRAGRGKEAAG
jgi:GPH family glycoside/pentoside/hexuronide:cation symporter